MEATGFHCDVIFGVLVIFAVEWRLAKVLLGMCVLIGRFQVLWLGGVDGHALEILL